MHTHTRKMLRLLSLLSIVLLAFIASPTPSSGQHSAPGAKAAEITISGSIQSVVPGVAGIHLLVSSSNGVVNASLGSNLSIPLQQRLHAGEMIQITGSQQTVQGKDYLLVRQMTVGGQQVSVRNQHGFLVHMQSRNVGGAR